MKSDIEILNELKEISPLLAGIEKRNVFSVPGGYFNSLPGMILEHLENNQAYFSKINSPHIPQGYFENLSFDILQKIKNLEFRGAADELKEIAPGLHSLKKENVYKVPWGYFTNFANQILQEIKPAKVIKIKSPVWRIAAAAIMTGMIAVSSLLLFQRLPKLSPNNNTLIEIPSYRYVSTKYKNEQQINDGISKLSDEEIIKYLETTVNSSDIEALTTNIDANDLPAQKDYLLEEKTLDTYLTQFDSKSSAN